MEKFLNVQYMTLEEQNNAFIYIINRNKELMVILDYLSSLNLPNFYIISGSIYQTIWNYYNNKQLNYGIEDIDVVYYDEHHLSIEIENEIEQNIINFIDQNKFKYKIDIHNEARIHLWKKENENKNINKYINVEEAIDNLSATIQAVGITKKDGKILIYAPYGLSDIFSKTIRPIKTSYNSKNYYYNKIESLKKRFTNIQVIDW